MRDVRREGPAVGKSRLRPALGLVVMVAFSGMWGLGGLRAQDAPKGPSGPATPLPDDPDRAVVARVCSTCHDLVIGEKQRYGRDRWEELVDQMVVRGMEATPDEIDRVVGYLAKYFGPQAEPSHK